MRKNQWLCHGVIGEYFGKNYEEVKQRPRFIIKKKQNHEDAIILQVV